MTSTTDRVREAAFRLLARRNHSSAELRQKLSRRGFGEADIAAVIAECAGRGYLNDEETARCWAEGLVRTKCWGRLKIGAYLEQKGIPRDIIDCVQRQLWHTVSEADIARRALHKRFGSPKKPLSRAQAASFLKARGFSSGVLAAVTGAPFDDPME